MMKSWLRVAAGLTAVLSVAACETPNSVAMRVGAPPDSAVKLRALETRQYDSSDQTAILVAATQTLQDLGFTISESSSEVGVLVASKQRDAEEAGQIAGQVVLTVAFALLGAYHSPDWDKDQTITVTVVTTPIENSNQVEVRASFDRKIRTNNGLYHAELIQDPEIYKQFFEKLSSGIFLEGHQT